MAYSVSNVPLDRAFDFLAGRECEKIQELKWSLCVDEIATQSNSPCYLCVRVMRGDVVFRYGLREHASPYLTDPVFERMVGMSKKHDDYIWHLAREFSRVWASEYVRFTLPGKLALSGAMSAKYFESDHLLGGFPSPVCVHCGDFTSVLDDKLLLADLLKSEVIAEAVRLAKGYAVPRKYWT